MPLVFSLPFCLLLPDGDFPVKLADNDIVNLHLTKVIPTIFDERLPFRGFHKGETDNISKLSVVGKVSGKVIDISDLPNYTESVIVTKYFDKEGKEFVPQIHGNDVNLSEPKILNESAKVKFSKTDEPKEWIDWYATQEHYHGRQIVINTEVKKDSFGRFRYTKVAYTSPKRGHMDEEFARAIKAVNKLIDIYRVETSDYWITNITENDIFIYKSISESDTQMAFTMKGFTKMKSDKDLKTTDIIKDKLINPEPQLPFMMLMLDADKSIDDGKYFLSVIYAITALESIVKFYIMVYASKKNIGDDVTKKLISLRLYSLVTTILRLFVKSIKFDDKLEKQILYGISLRNKIIHESELQITLKDAKSTIDNVRTLAGVLMEDLGKQVKSLESD